MAFKLGKDAKLQIGETELKVVTDVTINISTDTTDVTTRNSGSWKQEMPTLKTLEISTSAKYDIGNASIAALQTAFNAGTAVAVTITGGITLTASCSVTTFNITQPLADVIAVDITLKPAPSDTAPVLGTETAGV